MKEQKRDVPMTNYFVKNKLNDEEKITKEYKTKSSIYTIVAWIVLIICGWGIINSFEKWSIASWWLIILAVCSVIVTELSQVNIHSSSD